MRHLLIAALGVASCRIPPPVYPSTAEVGQPESRQPSPPATANEKPRDVEASIRALVASHHLTVWDAGAGGYLDYFRVPGSFQQPHSRSMLCCRDDPGTSFVPRWPRLRFRLRRWAWSSNDIL